MRYNDDVRTRLPALLLSLLAVFTASSAHAYSEPWIPGTSSTRLGAFTGVTPQNRIGGYQLASLLTEADLELQLGGSTRANWLSITAHASGSGLFLQRDPEGYADSVNLYAGMAWDPVNLRDPTGRRSLEECNGLDSAWDRLWCRKGRDLSAEDISRAEKLLAEHGLLEESRHNQARKWKDADRRFSADWEHEDNVREAWEDLRRYYYGRTWDEAMGAQGGPKGGAGPPVGLPGRGGKRQTPSTRGGALSVADAEGGELAPPPGDGIQFGQKRVAPQFRQYSEAPEEIRGRCLVDVADDLRAGRISPDVLPIKYFMHKGKKVAVNNRGLAALRMAGVSPTKTQCVVPSAKVLQRLVEPPVDRHHAMPGPRLPVTTQKDGSGHIYTVLGGDG